jgi:hypothetical protein
MTASLAMRVPTFTLPVNSAQAAFTVTIGAVTVISMLAVTSTDVVVSLTSQPPACVTTASCAASSSTTSCPDAIVNRTFAAPIVSSNSSRLLARDCTSRRLLLRCGPSGSAVLPFHTAPTM